MAHILVIDDDEQLLRMVGLMLERGGHTITLLNNPMEGLERIQVEEPDLLVLDVMMPFMNGHDVTRQIRNTPGLEDLPILILTARSQDIDRTTALKSGADGYLSKPVTAQELLSQIDYLLAVKKPAIKKPARGLILALYGMRGGTGRTTIAVNLAAALRQQSRQDVCLLELGMSGGQAGLHLRLNPPNHWDGLQQVNRLDWEMVNNHLMPHSSGIHLLAAPPMPQQQELPPARLATLLDLLVENMTFVVVDMPAVLSDSFRLVMGRADMALHVVAPDVVSLQTAVNTNRALSQAGIKPRFKSHILSQIIPNVTLSNSVVERGLKARIAFHVEYDRNQPRALTQGQPLVLVSGANSPLPVVVRRMAEAIWQHITAEH